jgi:hypothetical protein
MQKISISGPAELLAVLPFHLGFRPARSVVLVCFHERRLGLVVRLDACPPLEAHEVVEHLLPTLRVESPTRAMLISYEDVPGEGAALADALQGLLSDEDIPLSDRLTVRDGRWFGELCEGECCPPEGAALPEDADVPGVAGYVALGRSVLPGRESLTALIEPLGAVTDVSGSAGPGGSQDAIAALSQSIREFEHELEWARRLLVEPAGRSFYPLGSAPVDDSEIIRLVDESLEAWSRLLGASGSGDVRSEDLPALVGCLRDVHIRDALIAWLCPGTLGPEDLEPRLVDALVAHLGPLDLPTEPSARGRLRHLGGRDDHPRDSDDVQARLERLCRLVPAARATPVLSVVASYAWWRGDGVRAGVALERALDLEPDHRLCALLRRMVALGIRTDVATA